MTQLHYYFAPSGAGCTVHCSAAPHLQGLHPENAEHPVTREGVGMHWAGATILNGGQVKLDQMAPNGVPLDWELLQATSVYTDDVFEYLQRFPGVLHVEELIHNDALHPTDNGGTPDAWAECIDTDGFILIPLWDFKGGHGIVEAFENWQLMNYAALILKYLNVNGLQDQMIRFDFRIVQPRAYHPEGAIRNWRVLASDLRPYFNRLSAAYAKAGPQGVCPPATPGAHCLKAHCSAAGRGCSALAFQSWDLVDFAYESRPHNMDALSLGLSLRTMERALAMLEAQVEGMRGQAFALIANGKNVPYYTTAQGNGREVVPKEKMAEFIAAGEILGLDVAKPRESITPKQARDMGMPPDLVKLYAFQKNGERKLIQDDGTQARKVFG